jgi:hypothetical protein
LLLAVLTGAPAHAQGLRDMQLFAPAEFDQFGGGPRASEGLFFRFDGLCWWILPPEVDPIGNPGDTETVFFAPDKSTTQHNTHDNSQLQAVQVWGQRHEIGYIRGHHGFMASLFDLNDQVQRLTFSDMDMVFDDQPIGIDDRPRLFGYVADILEADDTSVTYYNFVLRKLPVSFETVQVENRVSLWGAEANYLFRTHPVRRAGIFEFLFGVRYLEFEELFSIDGFGDRFTLINVDETADPGDQGGVPAEPGSILADSHWWAEAKNHIVGPQLGVRWFKQVHRLTLSSEARFFAGFNHQNLRQAGILGTMLDDDFPAEDVTVIGVNSVTDFPFEPLTMGPTGYDHSRSVREWSPAGELRIDVQYKLTRLIDIRAGWSGLVVDGIARASNLIDYTLTENRIMGVDLKDNRQTVFMHGLNFGVSINR